MTVKSMKNKILGSGSIWKCPGGAVNPDFVASTKQIKGLQSYEVCYLSKGEMREFKMASWQFI